MLRVTIFCVATNLVGCAAGQTGTGADGEPSDFDPAPADGKADGVSAHFDPNNLIDDDTFQGVNTTMDASDVQAFLEMTPYHTRSWLASATVDGQPVSAAIVATAQTYQLHPLVLLSRMQGESGLVSKTTQPSSTLISHAMGCACPDHSACSAAAAGLAKQLDCAGRTLRTWFDASAAGTGQWRLGHPNRTLDPTTVTPATNATAAIYAYTPWVLVGKGGSWLDWNVSLKYFTYAQAMGLVHDVDQGSADQ
jgi:hypothetical protein